MSYVAFSYQTEENFLRLLYLALSPYTEHLAVLCQASSAGP